MARLSSRTCERRRRHLADRPRDQHHLGRQGQRGDAEIQDVLERWSFLKGEPKE